MTAMTTTGLRPEVIGALALAERHRRLAKPWNAARWRPRSRERLAAKHRRKAQQAAARAERMAEKGGRRTA